MIRIDNNIASVKADLASIPGRIKGATPGFFRAQSGRVRNQGKALANQVVYAAFPEGDYKRRGTSTTSLGILNSIVTQLNEGGDGMVLGILSGSSDVADTIPKTVAGRVVSDTYAAFMITGGGFLKPLGTDVRDFLAVWAKFFSITLPDKYMREVVIPAVRGI